jgi:haloalkane dehalogenase
MRNSLKKRILSDAEAAAYSAPFPAKEYQTAALVFPRLVPVRPDHPGAYDNRRAIERLRTLPLPVFLPWADGDPITASAQEHLRSIFPNIASPVVIRGAGHFLQEDSGEEVAEKILSWMETV